jgi:hypothetical protein
MSFGQRSKKTLTKDDPASARLIILSFVPETGGHYAPRSSPSGSRTSSRPERSELASARWARNIALPLQHFTAPAH